MKKWVLSLLCLVLLLSCALAEAPDEPALVNPQDRYEAYVENTDGSETLIFMMVDQMNDEAAIVQEHGALHVHMDYVNENGEVMLSSISTLQNTPVEHMMVTTEVSTGVQAFSLDGMAYIMQGQRFVHEQVQSKEDYDWYWESFCFPFGSLELLHGVRQDENGYTYFLIKSTDFRTFEYVVGENMRVEGLRVYEKLDGENLQLTTLVHYEYGRPIEVPARIRGAMMHDAARSK